MHEYLQQHKPDVECAKCTQLHLGKTKFSQKELIKSAKDYLVKLTSAPQCLVVQIMRFMYDLQLQQTIKISTKVSIPDQLDIREMMVGKYTSPAEYELMGIIMHSGKTAQLGHYVA